MAISTQTVAVDISKQVSIPTIHIGQGDKKGTTLQVDVYNDGTPFALTNYNVRFAMRLPHMGGHYEVDGTKSNNRATFAIDEDIAASVAGVTDVAYVEILDGANVVCSTSRIQVVCHAGAYEGVDPATVYNNGVLDFLAQARTDLDEAIDEAAEEAASHQAEAIAAKVPYPVEGSAADYGDEGQVLKSAGDGSTAWGTIGTPIIDDAAVTTPKLANGAVLTEKIADFNVTAPKIASNAVTAPKIANGAVNDDKLDPDGVIRDVAELREYVQRIDIAIDPDDLGLEQDEDTLYVYPTYRGVRSENGIPLASKGGGGGGGGNNAVITVTNTSGWLSRTVTEGAACPVTLEWSSIEDEIPTGNGSLTVTIDGSQKLKQDVAQGAVSVDLGPFLATGQNKAKVKVTDVYDNSRTITFTVNAVQLRMASTFDTSSTFAASEPVDFTYTPTGAVEKLVHFEVDGTQVATATVASSGRQQVQRIPAMAHGAHTLRAWFTCTVDGQPVESNVLTFALTVVDPASSVPIIASAFTRTQATQYETLVIPYSVYTPNSLTSNVTLKANGVAVSEQSVDRTPQAWSYRADDEGTLTLAIEAGGTSKSFTLTVAESDIDAHAETVGLALHLTSYGRSNNEAHPEVWNDGDTHCTLTGFNFTSDGWVHDADGITVLRVANDARVTIPFMPFASDFRATGKAIEFEFATHDVLDYDSVVIDCMSGGRGLQVTPQRATLKSEQSEISMQYKEDEHVRVSFVAEKRTENRLLYVYINGIASGALQYPEDDDFAQNPAVGITIGSNSCATDIYRIRVYDTGLTRHQILDNWIADTQDVAQMLTRYSHNNVYDAYGAITIDKLPGDLPYMVIKAAELPQYKGDKKTVEVRYTDPLDSSKSFTADGVQANVQGTSSAPYARKNYDLQFKSGFEMASGHAANYALMSTIVPFNRFVIKADVASSEGANNVELVKLFCEADPYKRPEEQADPLVRKGIWGRPIVLFWEDAGGAIQFMGKYNFNLPKRAPAPYGYTGNMESWEFQNNTSNLMLFQSEYFDPTMVVDPATGDAKESWRYDYEARFPEDTWTNTAKLQELQSFIYSTWRTQATGNALPSPVTYEGTEYTADTADYRLAKFRNEFSKYAEVDSFLFYYIFTELFLMVDSRAKNLFIGFSGGTAEGTTAIDRKAVAEPYDMDTALGINNEGSLAFGYSLEDTDHVAGADVFNGQESVLWCNVRDAFPAEISQMYQRLRSEGILSYANVEARFEQHQSKWPEAVFNEDAWFKYIDPLIDPDTGKEPTAVYLPMMQGSKAEQRKWWLYNRFRYMDSKWNAGDALSDVIQLRGYAKANITVTPYADIYPAVKYGSYYVAERGTHGVATELVCPLDNVNDTEIYVYSAPQLASVGDLSPLKVGLADFSKATRLQSIKVGDGATGYENPNLTRLDVGSNSLLASVDTRNCTALTGSVDLSGAANIAHVLMQGTAITGVNLPVGGVLEELRLPATVANLTVRNQSKLTQFEMPSYASITTLRVENTPAIPVQDILDDMAAGSRVRIIGFTASMASTSAVEAFYGYLDTMRGLDESGNNVDKAVVAGDITIPGSITGAWAAQMAARYPNIAIHADHITCDLRYWNYDGTTLLNTEQVADGGDGAYTGQPSRTSTAQYSYTFLGWALTTDAQAADANATKAVTTDRDVYAAYSRTVRHYMVRFLNGSTVLQTVNNVPYGGSATYTGSTPVDPSGEGKEFKEWSPAPTNIQANTDCVAQYKALEPEHTITDTWDGIIAAINDGSYKTKYSLGDTMSLDLGSEGFITVKIAAFDTDPRSDGAGNAEITWIAEQLLATSHRMNPAYQAGVEGTGNIGGWEKSEMRSYLQQTILPLVPSNVAAAIKPVKKYTRSKMASGDVIGGYETSDALWIPSITEAYNYERDTGAPYYSALFPDNASRKRAVIGSSNESMWWTRSHPASDGNSISFSRVRTSGETDSGNAEYIHCVLIGFCTCNTKQV